MRIALAAALVLGLAAPALAEDDESLVTYQSLKPELAIDLAKAAMEFCREQGYQVGVSVVDRSGTLQTFMRDR